MTAPSSIRLSEALEQAGQSELALKALQDHWHDWLGPLAMPAVDLVLTLEAIGTRECRDLARRVRDGEFDAPPDEWSPGDA